MPEWHTGKRTKTLRSDISKEYINKHNDETKANGVKNVLTVIYKPQQNGVAEGVNQTTVKMACRMLEGSVMLPKLWAEAVYTTTYKRTWCLMKYGAENVQM